MSEYEKHLKDPSHKYDLLVRYTHKKGHTIWVYCRGVIVRNQEGIPIKMIGTHTDVTELKLAEEKIERLFLAKNSFIASISHELRTPISGIMGLTSILLKNVENEKHVNFLRQINKSSTQLLTLVNDILDYSRMDHNKNISLSYENFSIEEVINDTIDMCKSHDYYAGIPIKLKMNSANQNVCADKTRFIQILSNIITNAIKFTEKGHISVIFDCDIMSDDKIKATIKVVDTGVGIPKSKQKNLFVEFYQVEDHKNKSNTGVGLGLAICKKLCNLMNGNISVQSKKGVGSTFIVELILQKSSVETQEFNNGNIKSKNKANFRILVAEDNAINQTVIKQYLQDLNVNYKIVDDGYKVIQSLQKRKYGLIFMDLHMPIVDGYTSTRIIRKFLSDIPIIALTANAMPGDRAVCLNQGFTDYISKPFTEQTLNTMIIKYVNDYNKKRMKIKLFDRKNIVIKPSLLEEIKRKTIRDCKKQMKIVKKSISMGKNNSASFGLHAIKNIVCIYRAYTLVTFLTDMEETPTKDKYNELVVLMKLFYKEVKHIKIENNTYKK